MCGIAGIFNSGSKKPIDFLDRHVLQKMTDELYHRGPDGEGFYIKDLIGIGHRRLSIIDIEGGDQPIFNEDRTICVIFNGEIFNYIELREDLKKKGHRFRTNTDTEVIVHAYEEYDTKFVNRLNGQFSIALWDDRRKKLLLIRDRVGIHPLYYTRLANGDYVFASEIKSLFNHHSVAAEIDPAGLEQIFTLWVNIPPQTSFKNIFELPPGHIMTISDGHSTLNKYWDFTFPQEGMFSEEPIEHYASTLEELLYDSIKLRLRSDVPVSAYLSGGLDSSIICSMLSMQSKKGLDTFSVEFEDKNYDETDHQRIVSNYLGTNHTSIRIKKEDIRNNLFEIVRLTECPLLRTAPSPMFRLSGLVNSHKYKTVLTGEGADEILGGYNIFKENKIRRFWAKYPRSKIRPRLLEKIYPYLTSRGANNSTWKYFFSKGLTDVNNPYYSHDIRWGNTSFLKNLFVEDIQKHFNLEENIYSRLQSMLPDNFMKWPSLCQAQFLELKLFFRGNLISSQGDRMLMGNSVEGRFPFLDHRLIDFAATIPPKYKLNGLSEKHILKHLSKKYLPEEISSREKMPYRAPIQDVISDDSGQISNLMSEDVLVKYGYFDPGKVSFLFNKVRAGQNLSERENMALIGVASQQILHYHFIEKNC